MYKEEGYRLSAILEDHLKSNIPQMKKLDLSYIELSSRNFRTICLALQQNSTVTALDLWGTTIGEESAQDLRDLLLQNNTIKWLKLGENKLSDLGLIYCSEGLRSSKSLKELEIVNFPEATDKGWNFFLRSMIENKIIEKLDIQGISFSEYQPKAFDFLKNGNISDFSVRFLRNSKNISELAESLKQCSNLTRFRFEAPSEDSTPFSDVAHSLGYCAELESVRFDGCRISKLGTDLLRKLLMKLKNLKSITLSECRDSDTQHTFPGDLFKALETNTSITELDLSESDGGCDAEAFAAIEKNTTLKRLDMQYLDIGNDAQFVSGVAKIIEKNQTLEDLNITVETTGSRRADLSELLKALKFNKSLTKLSLQGWGMKKEAVPFLCDSLKMNNSLKDLNLSYNDFGDDIAIQLAEVLMDNETLASLDLMSCELTNVGYKKTVDLMKRTTSLVELQLEDESTDDVVQNEIGDCENILSNLLQKNQSFQETNKKIAKSFMGHRVGKFFDDILVIFETPEKKTISK